MDANGPSRLSIRRASHDVEFGGWSDVNLMRNTYTHAEDTSEKIARALYAGLSKAEHETGLRLKKETK